MGGSVDRGRTAIGRTSYSRPVRLALEAGLIAPEGRVFDYGCGRGEDVRRLSSAGFEASGWDPHHAPDAPHRRASLVNLGFVINVIEDTRERAEALRRAWALAEDVLVVGARMSHEVEQLVDGGAEYVDGTLTRHRTFQKFYEQAELRAWIDATLGDETLPAVAAGSGVFFVFRDAERRQGYLASRHTRRRAVPRVRQSVQLFETHREALEPLMSFVLERGRLPAEDELGAFAEVTEAFGSVKRAMGTVRRATNSALWEAAGETRREELLLWLALSRFGDLSAGRGRVGRPSFGTLPRALQLDVRALFGTYKRACVEGDALLFAAGDRTKLEEAVTRSPVGKRLPRALYVHADALDRLPLLLQVYEGCARSCIGQLEGANVIKLSRAEPKVSYLSYPTFDKEAHPAIAWSMRVALSTGDIRLRDFRHAGNPAVLHRKETFLSEDDSRFERFRRLTVQEERAGLFSETATIGTRRGWDEALARHGKTVRGHRLVRR